MVCCLLLQRLAQELLLEARLRGGHLMGRLSLRLECAACRFSWRILCAGLRECAMVHGGLLRQGLRRHVLSLLHIVTVLFCQAGSRQGEDTEKEKEEPSLEPLREQVWALAAELKALASFFVPGSHISP